MKTSEFLSVIMPVYNEEGTFDEVIRKDHEQPQVTEQIAVDEINTMTRVSSSLA